MSDTREWMVEGFQEGVSSLPDGLLQDLLPDQAREYGLRAARIAIAPVVWAHAVGEHLDTSQVMGLLGVSRQALAKRVRAGSLLGIPGRGTTHYPVWQFDFQRGEIRPVVRHILATFNEELRETDPYIIAAWATTPQHEDLDGMTPAEWIAKSEGSLSPQLVDAARRTAARLAS